MQLLVQHGYCILKKEEIFIGVFIIEYTKKVSMYGVLFVQENGKKKT